MYFVVYSKCQFINNIHWMDCSTILCHRILQISVLILVLRVLQKIFVLVAYLRTRLSKQYKSRWDNFNVPVNPTHHHLIVFNLQMTKSFFPDQILPVRINYKNVIFLKFNLFHSISLDFDAKYKFCPYGINMGHMIWAI